MSKLAVAALCLFAVALPGAAQQKDPSTQQMIDALKGAAASVPPTPPASAPPKRKTRNLNVDAVEPEPPAPAPTPAPSQAPVPPPAPGPAPAPAPVAPPVVAHPPPALNLSIQFEFNSDKVRADSMKVLANLAAAMTAPELQKMRFRIEGHTDGTGKDAYNRKLSAMRADQVKKILVSHHVSADRLVAEGKGASELINSADPGAAENRRVKIVTLEK